MINILKDLPHHFVSASKGLLRHLAMTISSVSAVTVTLLLIAVFVLLAGNLNGFTTSVESNLKIHASIDKLVTTDETIQELKASIEKIDGVKTIEFSSKENELDTLIESNGSVFDRYKKNNPMPDVFIIEVKQASDIPSVNEKLNKLEGIEKAQYGGDSVKDMIKTFEIIRNGGAIFAAVLSVLAIFLISNTIKMTIYTRNKEISIMRSVGATNGYIKTPFMIEGMCIGMMGSLLPILISCIGYTVLYSAFDGQFLSNMFIMQAPFPYVLLIGGMLLLCGAIVGIVGSFFAVTKYLRWRR